jgi:hypothetical protein
MTLNVKTTNELHTIDDGTTPVVFVFVVLGVGRSATTNKTIQRTIWNRKESVDATFMDDLMNNQSMKGYK